MAEYNRYREEEKQNGETEDVVENTAETEDAHEETIDSLKEALKEKTNDYLKALADLENFKKRATEEMIRDRKYANQSMLEDLIVNFDIFEKALNVKTEDKNVQNFLTGFQMINNNFKSVLEKYGVKKIEALGKVFDPQFHQAVDTVWEEDKEENICLYELQTGYMFKDRVLRPSLVKVNKKPNDDNNK